MVIVDLDHLKRVNDSLGRNTGDRVIADVAQMLQAELGPGHVFGRLDSDEFGLLIPGVGEAQALERAEQPARGRPLPPGRRDAHRERRRRAASSATMGVSAADLLTAADIALHQAKEAGRDRAVVFTGEDRGRLEWVGHVRKAIEERAARPLLAADRRHGDRGRPLRRSCSSG